jgi:hypothetical protein
LPPTDWNWVELDKNFDGERNEEMKAGISEIQKIRTGTNDE